MEVKQNEKSSIGSDKIAILSGYALVLLFLFAFGCYGCAYQSPLVVPDEGEAHATLTRLSDTSWHLDTAAGEQPMPELSNMVITTIVFDPDLEADGSLRASLGVKNRTPLVAHFAYDEGHGIMMMFGDQESSVKVSYSASKDGKNETITFRASETNTQCYLQGQ